jgi:hypothetical protein
MLYTVIFVTMEEPILGAACKAQFGSFESLTPKTQDWLMAKFLNL